MPDATAENSSLFIDAVQIPAYLEADRGTPYTERLHRDRTIGASVSAQTPMQQVRAWYGQVVLQTSGLATAQTFGRRLQHGRRVIAFLMLVLGAFTGAGVASAVFHYDGTWPVNVVTVLAVPALMALLGERINALSIRSGPAVSDTSDGWYRLAWAVMRRPVVVALATTAFLLAAAAPLLATVLTGPSAEAVPPSQPSYVVNEYVEEHYDRSLGEGITVAVSGKAAAGELDGLRERVRALEGVDGGTRFKRASPTLAYATFAPAEKALSAGTQDAVREIRGDRVDEAEILVSGNTARFIDQKESLIEHTPLVVAIVCATTLFLLFMLTS